MIAKPDLVVQWPEERWGHAASIITGSLSPILVMIGGLDVTSKTVKNCWILDINEKSWTKVCHLLLLCLVYDISYILFK